MNAKGQGSFKENADGTVTHRKVVGYKNNGRRKVLTVTAANKTACIKQMQLKESEWRHERDRNSISGSSTVEDLCRLHLEYQVAQGELKPKSIDRRESTLYNQIAPYPLGHMQLHSVRASDIDDHVNMLLQENHLSASSIVKVIDVINAAFQWAIARGDLDFNPVAPIKSTLMKRIQKIQQKSANDADVVVLSDEEVKSFEKEAALKDDETGDYKYAAGLYGLLLLFTGMRVGEALALRWRDVDLKNGFLTIDKSLSETKDRGNGPHKYIMMEGSTKNSKSRKIKLLPEALQVIMAIRKSAEPCQEDDRIIQSSNGKSYTASNLGQRVAVIFKNAGITDLKGGLHVFRRTFATRLYQDGYRVKEIAAYIGDLESTTERYYIAVRKKIKNEDKVDQIVILPDHINEKK